MRAKSVHAKTKFTDQSQLVTNLPTFIQFRCYSPSSQERASTITGLM